MFRSCMSVLMWCLVGSLMLAAGCSDSVEEGKDTVADLSLDGSISDLMDAADGDVTGEVHAVTSATPNVAGSALASQHPGWGTAGCGECHTLYHGGISPADCEVCHGSNGAPNRPAGHSDSGCGGCHGTSHQALGFQAPGDCRSCHGYAADAVCPGGTQEVDVVVIGAGGGGLSAASRLAQAGMDVVVLERHNKVGGCMTNFNRGDYRFEASLHAMGGFDDPDQRTSLLFKELGIWDKVQPVEGEAMYRTVYPDFSFDTSGDVDEYLTDLIEMFPDETDGLTLLFQHLKEAEDTLNAALAQLDGDSGPMAAIVAENPDALDRFMGYLDKTLSEVLVDYITDPRLFAVFTQLACYAGEEPDKVSSLFFLMMWNSYHRHGFFYFVGGSQSVSDALAEVIRENNGVVHLNTEATDIIIEDGLATEVRTPAACYRPRYVVSNANAPATVELIGRENLPETYVNSIDEMTIGIPAFVVYLGVDKDYTDLFTAGHEIIIQDDYDPHVVFQAGFDCRPEEDLLLLIANYSTLDPTAAPEGKNVITLTALVGFDCLKDKWGDHEAYKEAKDAIAQRLILRAEEVLPELRDHIEVIEVAAAQTTWAYTGNPGGSFVGFGTQPEQSIMNRLPQETPIDNLFLAGAWTFPGGGQATVLMSGDMAADKILARDAKE